MADLTELLREILMDEEERRVCHELPEAAVVPVMKRKSFKELGKPTAQAEALGSSIKELLPEELLAYAQAKYDALVAVGEIDAVADEQPDRDGAPLMDDSIVGTELEVCWRYWRTPTAEEVAAGEKRKKIGVKIWCEGKVTHLANGTTTTANPDNIRCKKLADAGAVRIRWPEDLDREVPEPESFTWSILQAANFNKDAHLGWRLTKSELARRAAAHAAADK